MLGGVSTPSVEEFAATAAEWLAAHKDEAPPDYGAICPPELIDRGRAWQRRLFDAGFAGIHWPVEYGGRGLTPEHNAAWLVECAKAAVPPVLNMVGLVLAGGAILMYGTPEQKERHLLPTLRGEQVWCQLFSEPGAGSDLASLSTRAERDGDHFVVNGQKVWCSGGRVSDWGILMARTNPEAKKHEGISFFLCPMDLPGIEVRPLKQMTGGAEFDEVFFTDVQLPAEHLLGPLHGGWGVGMSVLTNERGHIGTAIVSLERRLESFSELGAERDLDPAARQRLAALIAKGNAYMALAQRQRDEGGAIATTGSSLLKLGISEMTFEIASLRTDTIGAEAMLTGPDTAALLAAPAGRIAGGTSQVQRNIIGERLLGLPREPR
jgi:alkylation response protein AidB-like acyl-CoA dehydrogenase